MKHLAALVLLLFAVTAWAGPVKVDNIRLNRLPGKSQLVFDVGTQVEYRIFGLDNPARLVVDIPNARLPSSKRKPGLSSTLIESVRTGIRNGSDLRIVVDLKGSVRSKAYKLKPEGRRGHRLVVDLFSLHSDIRPGEKPAAVSEPGIKPEAKKPAPVKLPPPKPRDIVVAIDPGHGGKDPGAKGALGTREKDVVLAIARRLKKRVDAEPGMKAVLTRNSDKYLRLRTRINIARKKEADLFISIHADAFNNPEAKGSSVFMLSTKGVSSEAARWLANSENAADFAGGLSLGDHDESIATVLLDLSQEATLESSMLLAEKMLKSIGKLGDMHKNRVERAGFVVLKAPDIPSVLIETAFLTNPDEEKRLNDKAYQEKLADSMMGGIREYFKVRLPTRMLVAEASEGDTIHVVRSGESLEEVAKSYQVGLDQLREYNALDADQSQMPVGTPLQIPTSRGS